MALISDAFDVDGQAKAVSAGAVSVKELEFLDGQLVAAVEMSITFKNPVDETDVELSAENSTEQVIRFVLPDAYVEKVTLQGLDLPEDL